MFMTCQRVFLGHFAFICHIWCPEPTLNNAEKTEDSRDCKAIRTRTNIWPQRGRTAGSSCNTTHMVTKHDYGDQSQLHQT